MPESYRDREEIARLITEPDMIVTDAERRRCIVSIEAWKEQMLRWHDPNPSPSLGAAVTAGFYWLDVYCGGCRQVATIVLGPKMQYHPQTALTAIAVRWKCSNCRGDGPFPSIKGISSKPPETLHDREQRKWIESQKKWRCA